MSIQEKDILYARPLVLNNRIVCYRLTALDDQFTDVSVNYFNSALRGGISCLHQSPEPLIVCEDGISRTVHERYGWKHGLLKATKYDDITWYAWVRPQFVRLSKGIMRGLLRGTSNKIQCITRVHINQEWCILAFSAEVSENSNEILGVQRSKEYRELILNYIISRYSNQIKKIGLLPNGISVDVSYLGINSFRVEINMFSKPEEVFL